MKVSTLALTLDESFYFRLSLIDTYPSWLGIVGTVFRPQFHFPDAITREFTSFKMSTNDGVNDVLKVLKISPHVGRECPVACRLLHGGLDAGLLALWNATKPNSCKTIRKDN